MKKIKVLHIIKTLNLGGAETNLFNLVKATDLDKVEIHVAYSYGGEIESRFKSAGVRLFKFASGDHKLKSPYSLWIVLRLAWYILKNDIQIVHTHIFNAHVWGVLAAKLCGRKVVEHVHDFRYLEGVEFRRRFGTNRQYSYVKYLKKLSDIVLVLTEQNYQFLVSRQMYTPKQVREIKNGIPISAPMEMGRELAGELKDRLGIRHDSFIIFTSARVALEKNVDLVFRIAPAVVRQVPNAVFVISGSGPLLDYYRDRAAELELEKHIRLIGFQPEIYPLLAISDIFLLPSFLELHSIAVLEAMSMQVPVVISRDVGCNNEFVKSWENGILLDPFTVNGWGESIVQLLKAPELRRKIGAAGYDTCSKAFDIRGTAKTIEDIYAELAVR